MRQPSRESRVRCNFATAIVNGASMRLILRIAPVMIGSLTLAACGKGAAPSADSAGSSSTVATTSASFDEGAARHEILAADSAFVRGMINKNVDSLMPYYDSNAVSLGKTPVKGITDVRKMYEQAV